MAVRNLVYSIIIALVLVGAPGIVRSDQCSTVPEIMQDSTSGAKAGPSPESCIAMEERQGDREGLSPGMETSQSEKYDGRIVSLGPGGDGGQSDGDGA